MIINTHAPRSMQPIHTPSNMFLTLTILPSLLSIDVTVAGKIQAYYLSRLVPELSVVRYPCRQRGNVMPAAMPVAWH